MESYKPELNYKVTIRCSKQTKQRTEIVMHRHEIAEAETLRYFIDAGLAVAETVGIGLLIEVTERLRSRNTEESKLALLRAMFPSLEISPKRKALPKKR